jgi:hypothetical protein
LGAEAKDGVTSAGTLVIRRASITACWTAAGDAGARPDPGIERAAAPAVVLGAATVMMPMHKAVRTAPVPRLVHRMRVSNRAWRIGSSTKK